MSVACYPTDIQSPLDPGGIQEPVPAPTVSKSLLLGMFTAWTTCIHLICSWCSACFFSQHLLPGHLARYPKSFLLKSQPLLPIWAINAIQGPRSHWGQYLPPLLIPVSEMGSTPHQKQELHPLTLWRRGSYSILCEI